MLPTLQEPTLTPIPMNAVRCATPASRDLAARISLNSTSADRIANAAEMAL